jgi:hypothetical protein
LLNKPSRDEAPLPLLLELLLPPLLYELLLPFRTWITKGYPEVVVVVVVMGSEVL